MTDFRFESGAYLSLLALLPVMMIFSAFLRRGVKDKLLRFAHPESLQRLIHGKDSDAGAIFRKILYYSAFVCFILAIARPQANPILEERTAASLDIMVLLDVSRSMDAEDMYPSRLKKAKRSIHTLLEKLSGDRVGIIAFAGSAALICPLTSDYEIVRTFLQALDSSTIQNQGTNIETALETAIEAFKRGSQTALKKNSLSHLVVLMSDGEETVSADAITAAKAAKEAGAVIHTIAFGTEKGVPIPIRDDQGALMGYKKDQQGNSVITTVKPQSLRTIAEAGGGTFYFSTLDEEEIRNILQKSLHLQRAAQKNVKARIYQEYFMFPLLLGIIALLLSYAPTLRQLFRSHRLRAAARLLIVTLLLSSHAHAAEPAKQQPLWRSFLWDKNRVSTEQAKTAYNQEKYEDAVEILKQLQANDPSSGTISYNLGTSYIKNKKYDEGRKALTDAAATPQSTIPARFNIAGSYAEENRVAEAREEYAGLIHDLTKKSSLDKSESALLELAKKNLEHLSEKQQQNQKSQSDSQQDEQKKEQESSQQDKQDQQSGEKQQNKQKDDKNKEGEKEKDPQKQEYDLNRKKSSFQERKDLSENDANRLLENLRQQEGQLQKKFLRSKEQNKQNNDSGKDW